MKKWIPLLVLVALLLALVPSVMAEDSSAAAKNVDRFSTSYYCDAPESLSYKVSGTTVKLSWPSYWLDDGYVIKENINGTWVQLGTTTGTSFTLKNVTKGTHRFGVATYWGSPDLIQSWNIRYVDVKVSAATVGKPSVTLKQTGTKKVKLTWKKTSNATSYVVYRSTKKSSGFKKIKTLKKVTYTDTVPKTNKTYYYKVVAKGKVNGKTKTATSAVKKIKVTKNSTAGVTYRALIIANSYANTPRLGTLNGILIDGKGLKSMLNSMTATPYEVTYVENADRATMFSKIQKVFGEAGPNDVTLMYFGGHGCEVLPGQDPGMTGALFTTDDTIITAQQLRQELDKYQGKKVLFFNTCYSGYMIGKDATITKGEAGPTQSQLEKAAQSFTAAFADVNRSDSNLAGNNYFVITAATGKEECWSNTYYGGIFIYCLNYGAGWDQQQNTKLPRLYADKNGDSILNLDEVFRYTKNKVDSDFYWILSGSDGQYYHQTTCVYPTGSTQVLFGR